MGRFPLLGTLSPHGFLPAHLAVAVLLVILAAPHVTPALSWANGTYCTSSAPGNTFGTHDWIAYHALDFLPSAEKFYILDNNLTYLCATELPDHGIGDTANHHVYYYRNGSLQDDASAARAQAFYEQLVGDLESGNFSGAAMAAAVMSHYIADVGVFGHVMGASTDWGAEVHHADYEDYVLARTDGVDAPFNSYLTFDGSLSTSNARTLTLALAFDTTFDSSGAGRNATWMDSSYDWSNQAFKDRAGQSLNNAVNAVADALHSAFIAGGSPIPEFPQISLPLVLASSATVALLLERRLRQADSG